MDAMRETTERSEALRKRIHETADYLRKAGVTDPEVGIILGTGLNGYADSIEDAVFISYDDIPNMSAGRTFGHRGQLIYGRHKGKNVVVLAGRFHYYECGSMEITAFPVRVLVELGIKRLIITNAAGAINRDFSAGRLMLITDHINLSGDNPLIGRNLDEYGTRFPDMSYTYDKDLRDAVKSRAADAGIDLYEGVYMMVTGPSFETPAEIRAFAVLGADAVGMSSVPEAIIANHAGLEIIGISSLANMAAGIQDKPLSNDEVAEMSLMIQDDFIKVVDIAIEV